MPLYHLGNNRTPEQLADMVELEAAGVCVFCPEQLDRDPEQEVVHRTAHWTVTPNEFPYAGTSLHLLLVPHEHVTDMVDLSAAARDDFWTALSWVRDRYRLAHYGLGIRNGDCRYTGGTIYHLHVHVIVGDVADPEHRPVRFKLSSRPPGQADGVG